MSVFRGAFGYKGENGDSAYEVAVKNGFSGTEQEWLATLGTTNHFSQTKTTYVTEQVNVTTLNIPTGYIDDSSFLDIYVNGQRLNGSEYTLNLTNNTINLVNALNSIGTVVEMVMVTISTNNLPIVEHIDSTSDNNTVPGTKTVYDFVKEIADDKVDNSNFIILSGTIPIMESESSANISVNYPTGLTKNNTSVLNAYILSDDKLITFGDSSSTPVIKTISLTNNNIVLEVTLGNVTMEEASTYKLILMKVGE